MRILPSWNVWSSGVNRESSLQYSVTRTKVRVNPSSVDTVLKADSSDHEKEE